MDTDTGINPASDKIITCSMSNSKNADQYRNKTTSTITSDLALRKEKSCNQSKKPNADVSVVSPGIAGRHLNK